MIVTRKIAVRIGLVLVGAVVVQLAFFSQLSLLGATPTIVPAVVVSLGLLGGGLVGAVCGFAAGFLLDSLLLETLGVSSLVLLAAGYVAGRYREGADVTGALVPAVAIGALTMFSSAGVGALELMLGVEAPVSLLVLREVFVQALLAALIGFAIYPFVRRVLAPALVDYVPSGRVLAGGLRRRARRRKRAATAARPLPAEPARRAPSRREHGRRRRRGSRGTGSRIERSLG